jgi:triacylglycerol lipase
LVHGIFDTGRRFDKMSHYLAGRGWSPQTIDLEPNDASTPLEKLAGQIAAYERRYLPADRRFILIGYSMGGIVGRFYLQRLGGLARVKQFISISTPHHGTWLAYLSRNPGSQQMRPNSEFLAGLNRDADRLRQVNHVSIWTPFDLTIVPASSSKISNGRNIRLPVPAHPLMLVSKSCLAAVDKICRETTQAEEGVAMTPGQA